MFKWYLKFARAKYMEKMIICVINSIYYKIICLKLCFNVKKNNLNQYFLRTFYYPLLHYYKSVAQKVLTRFA